VDWTEGEVKRFSGKTFKFWVLAMTLFNAFTNKLRKIKNILIKLMTNTGRHH